MKLQTIPNLVGLENQKIIIPQLLYWNSQTRFNVVSAGRRSGKTWEAVTKLVTHALMYTGKQRGRYLLGAPTRDQAKFIFWDLLLSMIPQKYILGGKPRIAELKVPLINADIFIKGMDVPERTEGGDLHGVVLDEYGNMDSSAFDEHIYPALANTNGWCDLIGVPEGRNHYYEKALLASLGKEEWSFHTWWSDEVVSSKTIEQAKMDLDEDTFRQEFQAEFISKTGLVYYAFSSKNLVDTINYDSGTSLYLGFDFNISPQVILIMQISEKDRRPVLNCIDEVVIENDSNTVKIIRKLISKIRNYPAFNGKVICCGDATGFAGGTAKTSGSDWDLVKNTLTGLLPIPPKILVPRSNPLEKQRVNYVNSLFKSYAGIHRCFINKQNCKTLLHDLHTVVWDSTNNIEKRKNKKITHISDALGYTIFALKHVFFTNKETSMIDTTGV